MKAYVAALIIIVLALTIPIFGAQAVNQPPVASFTYAPSIPTPFETITFNASASYDPDGYIAQYAWNFGDGNLTVIYDPVITHSYPIDGRYTVELIVTDDEGLTSEASAVIEVSTTVWFRVVIYGTTIPIANAEVTVYYKTWQGGGWAYLKAPASSSGMEILYDNMTQPDRADTSSEKYRNPGYTASILRKNASNIGFDIHPCGWSVYFEIKVGPYVTYWPNDTIRVYNYRDPDIVESHDYHPHHSPYWDPVAGTYALEVKDIPIAGNNPSENHPILVGVFYPPPPTEYYLTVNTDPSGITTIPGEGLYVEDTCVPLTAPPYIDISSDTRYEFNYWDIDGISQGAGNNAITVCMDSNHTATAHYTQQYLVAFHETGLSADTVGTVLTVNGSPKTLSNLPFSMWIDSGASVTYLYSSLVSSGISGKRFRLNGVTGPSSPITVTRPTTVTGNYVTQYVVTFAQGGLDSTAVGTVVTVNGSAKTFTTLPFNWWVDSGSTVTYLYNEIVDSSVAGKRFTLLAIYSPSSPFIVTGPVTITGSYGIQFEVAFHQSGLDSTATGTVVTVNGNSKTFGDIPYSEWVDNGATLAYTYNDIVLSAVTGKRFKQVSVSGPSSPITVTGPTTVTGNYKIQHSILFDQTGVGSDFAGTVVVVDGLNYDVADLPGSFWFDSGSSHSFSFASPLSVGADKQYVWASTTGLSTLQSDSITVSTDGSIIGNYGTQYYLTLATSPVGVASPSGSGWYDADTYATISTAAFIDIVPGSSRYRFDGWTTADMPEITDPTVSPTNVYVDKGKTVTANYAVQYFVVFDQTGVGSDFAGTVVVVDGLNYDVADLPHSFWWDNGTGHTFTYQSPLIVTPNAKQYVWAGTTGMSSLQSESIIVSGSGSVTGNYQTQFHLTVDSPYNSPIPSSDWFNAGTSITASVTSPVAGPAGTQYVSTGWTGTGSVPTSGSTTSVTFSINEPSSITWTWKTQYYLTINTNPLGLTAIPGEGWYDTSTSVPLTAPSVSGYNLLKWDVDGASQGDGVNPITVSMTSPHTATAHYLQTTIEPLLVSITPLSTTIYVGQSVAFTSNVSGGTLPYTYQWYLDGTPVSGATSDSWVFTPSSSGIYYVHLKVTDANSMTAQSETARVEVISVPVGGYSVPMVRRTPILQFTGYFVLIAFFGIIASLVKRKRK